MSEQGRCLSQLQAGASACRLSCLAVYTQGQATAAVLLLLVELQAACCTIQAPLLPMLQCKGQSTVSW